jgi:hypothetical protein
MAIFDDSSPHQKQFWLQEGWRVTGLDMAANQLTKGMSHYLNK